ncbi:AI-2E family transporter [Flavobacterium amnicola]|uniref:AI-2E family transporter n=1 Tax=Flavobacterium amnicola TaxID=2506422 RepID=A0A4Q1K124_9FLAO|nr:AI-2E family transporter [Flavobacterium amnicola]RXR17309.1 AI-2E family transporter [Flavobacterium amnicola]
MTSKIVAKGIVSAVLILSAIVLLLYFLFKIQLIIVYIIISIVLTMIGTPIVDFLRRRLKFKNTSAVITTLLFYGLIIFGFILMFIPLVTSQGEKLSLLDVNTFQTQLNELILQVKNYLTTKGINGDRVLKDYNVISKLNFNFLSDFLNSLLSTISNLGMGLASVFFITFFFLKDRVIFIRIFNYIIPDDHEEKILNSITQINELLSRYFLGILLQLFIVFVLYLIVLMIFGIENALIIAFLCAILNIIPYIGPLIGSVLAVILTLLGNFNGEFTSDMLYTSIYVMIGFFIVQFIDNNFSQPYIFSNSTKSHPLEIFLIILIFGLLFGITGMILAVPSYTILKVIGKEFLPDNRIIQSLTKDL